MQIDPASHNPMTSHMAAAAAHQGQPEPAHEEADDGNTPAQAAPVTAVENREIRQLEARDRQVRAHEQAHLAAAAGIATGGASFTYQQGPDGKRYASGGEVAIDTAPVAGDPRATLLKAEQIRRAALAPADPSTQDRQVAAAATQMAMRARLELQQQATDAYRQNAPGENATERTATSFSQLA